MTAPAAPILAEPPDATGATPVMAQYFAAKARQPDALVFFRMGDFYELFFEDAVKAVAAIGIALTHRGTHAGAPIPMAGVPVHTAEAYLAKLIRAGFKVAVCEQMEDPAEARTRGAKSVVRRELMRVITPGTLTEEGLLDARGANRLAAVAARGGQVAVASVELSTGEVDCLLTAPEGLAGALAALQPSEILVPDRLFADPAVSPALKTAGGALQPMAGALAEPAASEARLKRLYGVETLDGFGALTGAEIAALGLIAAHLEVTQAGRLPALRPPRRAGEADVMAIDPATRASLEIERTLAGAREGSLLGAIDRTVGASGARLLAARLSRPLLSPPAIEARLDAVAWLVERRDLREALRGKLKGAGDMARAVSRLALGRGGPRDLGCLLGALTVGRDIAALFAGHDEPLAPPPPELAAALTVQPLTAPSLAALAETLNRGLGPALPAQARDGGFVAAEVSADLDRARALRDDSRRVIVAMEARLASESGVILKIRHNGVLGYFVEASARQAETLFQPPLSARFIHRQTLASQVRFTTLELAELDARIARAADQALALELAVFEGWREAARGLAGEILAAAEGLARLDVAAGLAQWAEENDAARPIVDLSLAFEARAGRHPVVEAAVRRAGEAFTPNDCALDGSGEIAARLSIVTGPNMAGKSTFLRQNALIAILGQAGFFVPAEAARIGIVDQLFSRVGAADDLARGRSTFMVEMVETAAILNQAGPGALVILDEIGRGTATYDGLSIAWATLEHLHEVNRCRGLFATHYHELTGLAGTLDCLKTATVAVREWKGEVVFLHEVRPGTADRSYGVQVARLAGLPDAVIARAREVLERLETADRGGAAGLVEGLPLFAARPAPRAEAPTENPLAARLRDVHPDGLSPRAALDLIYELAALAREEEK
ncbi:MAG: DNA mismatch repair protein MutS [Caulobacteraceae bacterium]